MKIYYKLISFFLIFIMANIVFINCKSGSSKRREEHEARERVMREIEYGRLLAYQIVSKYPFLDDVKANLYINKVGRSVALFAGRTDIEYFFAILDTDSINAYATPGGYIFITKGSLVNMKNEAELAGVLAHEIAHVNLKHIMKELPPPRDTGGFTDRVAALLVARGAVISSALTEVVNKAAELLFSKGYKIQDEFEADRTAIYYAAETGYYPNGLADFLKRIKKYKSANAPAVVYNTHPPFTRRIDALKEFITIENFELKRPKVTNRFVNELGHLRGAKPSSIK